MCAPRLLDWFVSFSRDGAVSSFSPLLEEGTFTTASYTEDDWIEEEGDERGLCVQWTRVEEPRSYDWEEIKPSLLALLRLIFAVSGVLLDRPRQ